MTAWDPAKHLICMEGAGLVGGPYWKCPTCSRIFRKAQTDLRPVYEEHRVRCIVTVPIGQQQRLHSDRCYPQQNE